ncbi:MAG: RraA family protein [Sphingomonas sp.]|uniref:RraA family protein n=1 Tax=Sphingomonas sp. TaxID=28214 RepID=UPI001AD1E887|nr:RraA family protein [Sphingomonas sp.]MBN8816500.1 RraA family protein [Sphingomonas sp.]
MIDAALIERASKLSSATMHEASGRRGALPASIRPIDRAMRLAGVALPVRCPLGDNLWIHRALAVAEPWDVLVIEAGGGTDFGYWGEIMATMAVARRLAGIVISGGVRDTQQLISLGLPTFSSGVAIRGTEKDPTGAGAVGEPVRMGETVVKRGDLIVGDADGVACFDAATAANLIAKSEERDLTEALIMDELRGGASTLEIYRLE